MSTKPEPRYVAPTLESITIRAKYKIQETDFNVVKQTVKEALHDEGWVTFQKIGESITLTNLGSTSSSAMSMMEKIAKSEKQWGQYIRKLRSGVAIWLSMTTVEHYNDSILVEVECRPAMWFRISQGREISFTENEVQEALLECKTFLKQVMSVFKGKEIEPVSVYPVIPKMEIKSRLLNLGLKEIVEKLDTAERHIVQNNFADSLKSSRTAFEKMVDWQMEKRGLEKTNNYKNDLERLKSKGYLDVETTKLLQTCYSCLSNIGVHEKAVTPAGLFEAQMGYGITLIILDYFANKLP